MGCQIDNSMRGGENESLMRDEREKSTSVSGIEKE